MSNFVNFDSNVSYFIGYFNINFFLPSYSYQSNSMSVVLNILRQMVCNQSL